MTIKEINDEITNYAKSIWEATPQHFIDNDYYYYTIVIYKTLDFIERYNSWKYVFFDLESIEELLEYDKNDFRNEMKLKMSYLIEKRVKGDEDYSLGMDKSPKKRDRDLYLCIYERAVDEIVSQVMELVIEAFDNQFIEEILYFFLIVEKYKERPTKKLYCKYMDFPDKSAFIRDLKINQILAPKKRVKKVKK